MDDVDKITFERGLQPGNNAGMGISFYHYPRYENTYFFMPFTKEQAAEIGKKAAEGVWDLDIKEKVLYLTDQNNGVHRFKIKTDSDKSLTLIRL